MDWVGWHEDYRDPDSALSLRLREVQRQLAAFLDQNPDRPVRLVSACAGDGRDVIEVLAERPDRDRVSGRLVELDPTLATRAGDAAAEHGLTGVEVVEGDAGIVDAYRGAVPADLVLFCGVFGNIADADIERTIATLPQLCAPGATVIWTRGRRTPDLLEPIRRWFDQAGFTRRELITPEGVSWSVGVERLTAGPVPFVPGERLFTFVDRSRSTSP